MGKSVVSSFSYHLSEAAIVAEAEDKAKSQGMSFSEYLVSLVKEDVRKKDEAQSHVSILGCQAATIDKQITLDKFFPHWILDYKNWQKQNEIQSSLSEEERKRAQIALVQTAKRWAGRTFL